MDLKAIIIPPAVPHGRAQLGGPVTYLVFRGFPGPGR